MGKTKASEKGIPYGAREKMPMWYNLIWSSRGISAAINVILIGYITFFSTDILGLSASVIGMILLGSKVIDAFTDLGFGYILDKTRTKIGKARPYEVFIVFEWIFTVIMFAVPDAGKTIQYVWLFVTYVIINAICSTALGGIDSVYLARAFSTDNNRIKAISVNGFVVMFSCMIFNIMIPQFIAGEGTTQSGWIKYAITLAIPMALIGILRFVFVKEIVVDEPEVNTAAEQQKLSMKESMGHLFKNKYMFIIVGLMFFTFIVNNMSTATTYYFKYIMGDVSLVSIVSMTSLVVIPGFVIFPWLARKIGTTKILQYGSVIGLVGIIIRTIGGANMTTFIVGGILFQVGVMPITMMINTYLIDCMDYGEWKTGVRIEGLVASINNFAGKLGSGIAAGLIGLVMGLTGYDGSLAVQSEVATNAIVILYNWFPLVLFVIMTVLAFNYKIDKFKPQMAADLAKKHEQ